MIREIAPTGTFRQDYKRLSKSSRHNLGELKALVDDLAEDRPLAAKNRDHALTGNWRDHRECHVRGDWLLIYRLEPGRLILVRTGTHSELFK